MLLADDFNSKIENMKTGKNDVKHMGKGELRNQDYQTPFSSSALHKEFFGFIQVYTRLHGNGIAYGTIIQGESSQENLENNG